MKNRQLQAQQPGLYQGGFILTLELMLILTVLGIGLLVGVVAVRDALFQHYASEQSKEIYVSDANDTRIGKTIGFDEHEAPLLLFVDRSQAQNNRVLLGVRDDRFTSREPIYYTLPNCQGDPCMKRPSSEDIDNQGVDFLPGTGAVSYLYALQQGPTYGVGAGSSDRLKGTLYRATEQSCPVTLVGAVLGSRWISQKVVSGEPCEPFVLPLPTVDATNSNKNCKPKDLLAGVCIESGGLVLAQSVADPSLPGINVLDGLTAPFSVNLPIDNDPSAWHYTPPRSEVGQ
ncbi:MAG: hypothetical protein ACSHXZ_13585 [Gammaproteobacteria bacterium]